MKNYHSPRLSAQEDAKATATKEPADFRHANNPTACIDALGNSHLRACWAPRLMPCDLAPTRNIPRSRNRSGKRPPRHLTRRHASAGHIGAGHRHVLSGPNRSASLRRKTGIARFHRSTAGHGPTIEIVSTGHPAFLGGPPGIRHQRSRFYVEAFSLCTFSCIA